MIRATLALITTAFFLAGCNPPASVVAPAPAPTQTPTIAETLKSAVDGSTVIFNTPIRKPVIIEGYTNGCDIDNCKFKKIELAHLPYDSSGASPAPYSGAGIEIQGGENQGHGTIIKSGTSLTQLWVKGFNNTILFEQNVFIKTISVDGQGTGFNDANANTNHTIANAGQSDRCTNSNQNTDLCTGFGDTGNSIEYYGNLELENIEITSHKNYLDLRYGKTKSQLRNTNPTAQSYLSSGWPAGRDGYIHSITVQTNDNTLWLCGRVIGNLSISGTGNTIYINEELNQQLTPTYDGDSGLAASETTIDTEKCLDTPIRP